MQRSPGAQAIPGCAGAVPVSLPAFATLLERLVFTPGRNAKLALLRHWFATQPDPDRGVGLAALTGELSSRAGQISATVSAKSPT